MLSIEVGCGEGDWTRKIAECRRDLDVLAFDTDLEPLLGKTFPGNCTFFILNFLTMKLPPKLEIYGAEVVHSRCDPFTLD